MLPNPNPQLRDRYGWRPFCYHLSLQSAEMAGERETTRHASATTVSRSGDHRKTWGQLCVNRLLDDMSDRRTGGRGRKTPARKLIKFHRRIPRKYQATRRPTSFESRVGSMYVVYCMYTTGWEERRRLLLCPLVASGGGLTKLSRI